MGSSRDRVIFNDTDKLAVPVLLENTFIDKIVKSIHPARGKIDCHYTPPLPVVMVHKARNEAKKNALNDCQINEKTWPCW